ncbi:MAG TPA: hypothetical protein VFN37_01930 [Candidatus Baltobacteraceae bacterium]|nr:hypothetical protein [Candidatus Baltobacteraceae bacterium]
MENNIFRTLLMGAAFALFGSGIASAATTATPSTVAQATPAPKASATPSAFTYSGYVRAYYFTRTNFPQFTKTQNQASENQAVNLHAGYDFGGGFSVAGSYLYANPFNNCEDPVSHVTKGSPCYKGRTFGSTGGTDPDDTLPGYKMSTLYEAYLQYKNPSIFLRLGDQVINTPWANSSDSRLKPVAFRGGDFSYKLDKSWTLEAMYMNRWEDRVASDFTNTTILTQNGLYPDAGGVGNTGIKPGGWITNNGFYYGRAGYAGGALSANVYYYGFDQIANAIWADAKFTAKTYGKPFLALQGGSEANTGTSLAGKIDSQIFGIQAGYSPWNNVDLSIGADFIPVKSDSLTLPLGTTCAANHEIKGTLMYFLPAGGTPNCVPGATPGTATLYYGGWASPYTDSYATDQLFDTSISQGMVDRRSPGSGVKLAGTFYTDRKQVRLIASHAWYVYGNGTVGISPTQETDIDATYFFSKVGKGAYHGFSLRHRYAERTQSFTAPFGGLPDFIYNRTQLEYDF